jgi:hypothetical protein
VNSSGQKKSSTTFKQSGIWLFLRKANDEIQRFPNWRPAAVNVGYPTVALLQDCPA